MKRGTMFTPPRRRALLACYARIDGRHEWIYVGGTTARCAGCGAEAYYDPWSAARVEQHR